MCEIDVLPGLPELCRCTEVEAATSGRSFKLLQCLRELGFDRGRSSSADSAKWDSRKVHCTCNRHEIPPRHPR